MELENSKGWIGGLKAVFILFLTLVLTGCVRDITHDARFQTDYVVGATYKVQRTLLLLDLDEYAIEVPRSDWEIVSDLKEAKRRVPYLIGYVPAGTLLRFEQMKLEYNFEMGHEVWAKGRFIDGTYADKQVELHFASKTSETYPHVPQVDPSVLQRTDADPTVRK